MCHAVGLPLILEPIVWSAPGEELGSARLAELVVAMTESLAPLAPGLLKLQYPGSRSACDEVHAACGGHPWVLLGGGAPLAELEVQLADACAAGAIGCIVGRSLFDGALDADVDRRRTWLSDVAVPALTRLSDIAAANVVRPRA
jgi:tagatose-1,6-bisphosphate aldolase